ncbi:MAG: PilZ domain-containing protein [Nitrospirota bacterium]|nr:PilZ domain-containing protein [Nitrospirota bacterium]
MKRRPAKPITTPLTRPPRAVVSGQLRAALCIPGQMEVFGDVQDLSEGGMFLRTYERFPQDCPCECRLIVDDGPADIRLRGWVAHLKEVGMAVQFDELDSKTRDEVHRIMNLAAAGFSSPPA